MKMNIDETTSDESKQEARVFLRERFLRLMSTLTDQEAEMKLYAKAQCSGVIRAMDINVQHIQVRDLQTPIGVIPEATLRLSDTVSIKIQDFKTSDYVRCRSFMI